MSDTSPLLNAAIPGDQSGLPVETTPDGQKRKKKVRSAWISFVSRILAQLIGAAATVFLGLIVLQRYQIVGGPASEAAPAVKPAGVELPAARDARRDPAGSPSVAVLPFESFSGDADQGHLADALTETLVSTLTQSGDLRVISRTSSMHYRGTRKTLREIGRELDVDLLIEGSIARAGTRVRVIAQLIDARTDEHIWAASYVREVRDPIALQDEVSAAIVRDLRVSLSSRSRRQLAGIRSGAQWQEPLPESRKDAPATGTNSQR